MLIFVGNSHIDALTKNLNQNICLPVYVTGASIKGLVNPESKLKLREAIEETFYIDTSKYYIFLLGQVDVEFGYYYKSVKEGIKLDFKEYVSSLIKAYDTYLEKFPLPFCVCSIYPSVIRNIVHNFNVSFKCNNGFEGKYSEVDNIIEFDSLICKEVYRDSYLERIDNCRYFNTQLYKLSKEKGYRYIDLWDELMIGDYEINPKYVPHSDYEHHLAEAIPPEIVIGKIQTAIQANIERER